MLYMIFGCGKMNEKIIKKRCDEMKEGNKQIVKIITSLIFGSLGSSVLSFVIGLEILSKTNSALAFGGTQLIGPVVSLVLLPFAGAVVDRFEKKKIIFIAQVVSILMLVFYAFSLKSGISVLISTYLLLIVLRLADIFLSTAYGAATIHLVDEADLQKVRSFEQLVSAVSQIIAPIIGGIIYVLISLANIVLLEVVCETLAAMILMMVNFHYRKVSESHVDESQDSLLKMFLSGLNYIKKDRLLVFAMVMGMSINFVLSSISVGIPYIQIHQLHFPTQAYSFSESAFGFGLILASLILSMIKNIRYPLLNTYIYVISLGAIMSILGFILMQSLLLKWMIIIMIVGNFIMGVCITLLNVPMNTWLSAYVDPQFQGRVFHFLMTGVQLLMPLGIVFYSFLFEVANGGLTFFISGIVVIVMMVLLPILLQANLKSAEIKPQENQA